MEPIEHGKDYNYFKKLTVINSKFPNNSHVTFNIKFLQSFSLINEGTAVIEYSFNGNTVHGDLSPGTPSAGIFFDNRRVSAIWFRKAEGGADSTIRIEGWGM
jgi:hypothetical protein